MFESLGEKFESAFRRLKGQHKLTEDNIKDALREVRMALLEADVNYLVVKDFVARVREEVMGEEVIKGVNPAQQFVALVHKHLVAMMTGDPETDKPFAIEPGRRQIVLMLGLQGSGKTTFCGKLATRLSKEKCKPLLIACDIYRPAAIDQLKQVGSSIGVPVFERGTQTPVVEIIAEGLKEADRQGRDVVIIDTAGRLHIDEVKMDELQAVRDRFSPDFTFLVADAMTGQDAVNSAKAFADSIGIDGVCLTKMDGDSRGGAALSIKAVTGKPVVFVGLGEKSTDLEPFHPSRAADRILGMGDVVSLVEKAQEAISEDEAKSLQDKLGRGTFSYNDFLEQMRMIKRMGPLKGLLGMLPGIGSALKDVDGDLLDGELKRVESILYSMTEEERQTPDLVRLEGRRRDRIAKGSGRSLKQVNELVKQFEQMRGMMQQFAGGGMMGAMGGGQPPAAGMPMGGPGMMQPPDMGPPPEPGSKEFKRYQRQLKELKKASRATLNSPSRRSRSSKKRRK